MNKSVNPKFNSFFMAGFECTYALDQKGRRFDLLAASRHDELIYEDYQLVKNEGILTVREGLSWSQIDRGGEVYDFSRFEPLMRAAKEIGIQQIWDLNHFDFPENVDPFSSAFPKRFAEYAKRAIETIRKYQTGTLYICPINEPSFFSWMCDMGRWAPFAKGRGYEFKKQLVRAAVAAMDAIWSVDRNVCFVHCDPIMHRQPLRVRNAREQEFCRAFNDDVRFQSWDMIFGRVNPELGGRPEFLGMIGVNYYFHNQEEVKIEQQGKKEIITFRTMPLKSPRRLQLSDMLARVYERYNRPMFISETGSHGKLRAVWWAHILRQVEICRKGGLPLYGICAYPTLDIKRGAGFVYPNSGLWDFAKGDKSCSRLPHEQSLKIIRTFIKQKLAKNTPVLSAVIKKTDF